MQRDRVRERHRQTVKETGGQKGETEMDTVRQTEEARVRQNSSERDAERDTEAERPRREQSDGRKHRGRGTVLCGEGSRDRSREGEEAGREIGLVSLFFSLFSHNIFW